MASTAASGIQNSTTGTTSSSNNTPVRQECDIPGKNAYMLWRTLFVIDEKYTPIKAIGKGAYGVVCSAKVAPSGDKVAIKKIGRGSRQGRLALLASPGSHACNAT